MWYNVVIIKNRNADIGEQEMTEISKQTIKRVQQLRQALKEAPIGSETGLVWADLLSLERELRTAGMTEIEVLAL